jgi:hypothetical protein
MELIDGPTLSDRVARETSPNRVDDCAADREAADERGIVIAI